MQCWAPAGISLSVGRCCSASEQRCVSFLSLSSCKKCIGKESGALKNLVGGTTLHWTQNWFAAVLLRTPFPPVPTFCRLLFSSQTCKFFKKQGITAGQRRTLGALCLIVASLPNLFPPPFCSYTEKCGSYWCSQVNFHVLMWTGTFSISFARAALISREPGTSCSLTVMLSVLIFIRKLSPESTQSGRGPTT